MENVTVLSGGLILRDITILRNKETKTNEFKAALGRIGLQLACAAGTRIAAREIPVETPITSTTGHELDAPVVLVPILRAGLGLLEPFLTFFPFSTTAHLGLKRNEETLLPYKYYSNLPHIEGKYTALILDPMLATGGSASFAVDLLKQNGAEDITLACVIAAPEGISAIHAKHPDVKIITAVVDSHLNEIGYIVPGLGDAGDRLFNT